MDALQALQRNVNDFVKRTLSSYQPRRAREDKVIRDGATGFNRFYRHEINIIDSPLLQRLRRIHQTALAMLTYPSARHTRFEHSLGCVILADRLARALNERKVAKIEGLMLVSLRLAALLHDCGHLPFSHGGEPSVASTDLYRQAAESHEDLFADKQPHEILSCLIVKSDNFKRFWERVVDLYSSDHLEPCDLQDVDLPTIADMILGRSKKKANQYLADVISGPLDVDKLDYFVRDTIFSGLKIGIDIDRLFYTIEPVKWRGKRVLAVAGTGVSILEQIAFNKMTLYSNIYHHQKVRAALGCIQSLLESLGGGFKTPSDFLSLDDFGLLSTSRPASVRLIVEILRERRLPKRILVLFAEAIEPECAARYSRFIDGIENRDEDVLKKVERFRRTVARRAGINKSLVHLDVPEVPRLGELGECIVKMEPGGIRSFKDVYPLAGWTQTFGQYKQRSYVFGPPEKRGELVPIVRDALNTCIGIKIKQLAVDAAKHDTRILLS
jgi:HD superfamily phosphohydrolase